MHIDTDKAVKWLDQLRDGVENGNNLAECIVTRARAASLMYLVLDSISDDLEGFEESGTLPDAKWLTENAKSICDALSTARGEPPRPETKAEVAA